MRPTTTTVLKEWVKTQVSSRHSLKYLDHFDHHYDPKIKHKIAASIDDTSHFPDKLEVLKDQNMKLKSKQKDLEEQVKIIATKLKR